MYIPCPFRVCAYIYIVILTQYIMDNRTQYARLRKMLVESGKTMMTFSELQGLVMRNIGSGLRTVEMAMRTMGATGLIKDIGKSKFEVLINGGL